MTQRTIKTASILAITAVLFGALTACAYTTRSGAPTLQYDSGGSYDYYYYPRSDVYYHPHTGRYYYRQGSSWSQAQALPNEVRVDTREMRRVTVREREPYNRHQEHRRAYESSGANRYNN